MDASRSMQYNWKGVLLWCAVFHFIGDPLRDLILTGNTSSFIDLSTTKDALLTLSGFLSFSLYSFMAYYCMQRFYPKRNWTFLIAGLVLSIIIPILFRNLLEQKIYPLLFGFQNYYGHTIGTYFRDNLYYAFKYILVGIGYYLVTYSFYKEKRARQLEQENQKMVLSHLRSQVNPHFLLNSLNNIYSLIYQKSDQSLVALDKLSDLLKYSLYSKKDLVLLEEELDHLEKYIELQSMRYNYPIDIRKDIEPTVYETELPQLLLQPLVENAFKHGDLKSSPIFLKISKVNNTIAIEVKNKIAIKEKDSGSGIGLENVKKRLLLTYDEGASFESEEREGYFYVRINLPAV